MEKWFYFFRPINPIFHDITTGKVAPRALQSLLGLGVNFCPTPLRPTLNTNKSMERFKRDLHICSVFAGSEELIPIANPKIYVRSKWKPPAWDISLALKRRLRTFRKALEPKFRFRPVRHNLLPHQRRTIGLIKLNPKLMVIQTDKGLGPGAIEPREYVLYATRDHLGDTRTYQRLTPAAAAYRATSVQKLLENWIRTYLDVLSKEEIKCLCTYLRLNEEPWGFLYLLFKVHKTRLKDAMVIQTDKGLGPGAIEPREYVLYATRDHLGDTRTYQRLTPAAAAYRATSVQKLLENWIRTYLDVLSKEEIKCLCTYLRLNEEPWGFLYLLFKVHKNPLKRRPVVSYCNNLLHPLGQLIIEWLQPLAKMHKDSFQDSFTLKKELDLQKIPSNARLFK